MSRDRRDDGSWRNERVQRRWKEQAGVQLGNKGSGMGTKGERNEEEEVAGSWRERGTRWGEKERAFALGVVRVQRRRDAAWWKMATRPILFIDVRFAIIARPS